MPDIDLNATADRLGITWAGTPEPDTALDVDGWADTAASADQARVLQERADDRTSYVFGGAA